MAQQIVERAGRDKHNYARTGRMALYGGGQFPRAQDTYLTNTHDLFTAVFGPVATIWYKFLQQKINFRNQNLTIVTRVLADQCVFATCNVFVFLSSMAIMEGSSPTEKLKSTYGTVLAKNWMVWPGVQLINFKFVPLEHRVLVVNIVSLGELLASHRFSFGDVWKSWVLTDLMHSRLELLSEFSQ